MEGAPSSPRGPVLSLIGALSNPTNHDLHVQAIDARDRSLAASVDSYNDLCLQLLYVLIGSDQHEQMMRQIGSDELASWKRADPESVARLLQDPSLWIPFGQMAGLILKDALLRPPADLALRGENATLAQKLLLLALSLSHSELRNVASSIISTCAVAPLASTVSSPAGALRSIQPALHLRSWTALIPTLISNVSPGTKTPGAPVVDGSLVTIRKIMEDGPDLLDQEELDLLVTVLIEYLAPMHPERYKLAALQSLTTVLNHGVMPSALVLHFDRYLTGLSSLAVPSHGALNPGLPPPLSSNTPVVRQWVCRNIVALLENRPEFVRPHFQSISNFMLSATSSYASEPDVALDACEFWLTLANLDEDECSAEMSDVTIQSVLPALVPILVQCMVYPAEKREELLVQNTLEASQKYQEETSIKPVFHRSKSLKKAPGKPSAPAPVPLVSQGNDDDEDEIDDDSDAEDEDANEWTLRKCAAASLDSLAGVYGADPVLPHLLPDLEVGLKSDNPWIQEASILALGAVADGCTMELSSSLTQLYPLLLHILSLDTSASSTNNASVLPQLQCICAWAIGRYAHWAVEQVQTGAQGQLLAHMTQIFMARLGAIHRRVQVACCAAFAVLLEVAGDLMAPYLRPIYQTLVSALTRYRGQSLRMLFDVMGTMADSCGPTTAEGDLPTVYIPPVLRMWSEIAGRDPTDRTLLSLMESLASIALTSGANYQPYALETYENAMAMIEQVKLLLVTTDKTRRKFNDEDVDPIICAVDLLDGVVEGMGANFHSLVKSSSRYGPNLFLTVLHSLLSSNADDVVVTSGVLMSALALLGDLVRNCPGLLEPALLELLTEAIQCMDPAQGASVCTNAVWAVGEVCSKCRPLPGQRQVDSTLAPLAPQIMQNLISLLMGNGAGRGSRNVNIPGLAENAAACVGRLALANPGYVAPELPRFLLGWCEGLAKVRDPVERHDAFFGFVAALYFNPKAIENAVGAQSTEEAIVSILYAVMTWHIPDDCLEGTDEQFSSELLCGPDYSFRPFPQREAELGAALVRLIQDIKAAVSEERWGLAEKGLPVNVRRLLRQSYNL